MLRIRLLRPVRHLAHCLLMAIVIYSFVESSGALTPASKMPSVDPFAEYGIVITILLYLFRLLPLLALPQTMTNFLGLTLYNAFPPKVKLKVDPSEAPFLCLRVVTRGGFPDLVKANVQRNLQTCLDLGMVNFVIEVATDKEVYSKEDLLKNDPIEGKNPNQAGPDQVAVDIKAPPVRRLHPKIKQTVVPEDYKTSSGAMFKARALQYCLEDDVNELDDDDYVLHLDEETLVTRDAMKGVLNFISQRRHPFGQGVITYANERIVNWVTTLADTYRVADDFGKIRFQFKFFHKPLFSWKGSYVCCRLSAERAVSFDNGPDGSVAEDCFFSMVAFSRGYSFEFIEGALWEKSPFTVSDLLQQRKRWLQGIFLVVHSPRIPPKYKVWLACSLYAWATMPLATSNLFLAPRFPLPCPQSFNIICATIGAFNLYMYFFGVLKSFSIKRQGLFKFAMCLCLVFVAIPVNIFVENIAVVWGLLGDKHKFYIVDKNVKLSTKPLLPV